MISLLLLTVDRLQLTKTCIDGALARAGTTDYEILICDNGSIEAGMKEYLVSLNPAYLRMNKENKGIAAMYNQLILRAKGDYFCIIDPDILLPRDWLKNLEDYAIRIPRTGVSGIHCVEKLWPLQNIDNVMVHYGSVFGTKFFTRQTIEKIGYYNEEYFPYGFEDADFGERARRAGLVTYYIPGYVSEHLGADTHLQNNYRQMKNNSITENFPKYTANLQKYARNEGLYISAPELDQ